MASDASGDNIFKDQLTLSEMQALKSSGMIQNIMTLNNGSIKYQWSGKEFKRLKYGCNSIAEMNNIEVLMKKRDRSISLLKILEKKYDIWLPRMQLSDLLKVKVIVLLKSRGKITHDNQTAVCRLLTKLVKESNV